MNISEWTLPEVIFFFIVIGTIALIWGIVEAWLKDKNGDE